MSIIRPIIAGILTGAALFFMPFFFVRFILFLLIIGTIFRFFIGRRFRGGYRRGFDASFADNIRNMSEEEYSRFKQHVAQDFYSMHYNRSQPKKDPE